MNVSVPASGDSPLSVPILGPRPCKQASCLVVVTIRPVAASTLDGNGRLLHCRWEWPSADSPDQGLTPVWGISDTTGGRAPIQIESDEGSFWVPATSKIELTGGVRGEVYAIEAMYYDRAAPPSESVFGLTTTVPAGGGPLPVQIPPWHTRLRVLVGSVTVNGLVVLPGHDFLPLTAAGMIAAAGTIYRTEAIL